VTLVTELGARLERPIGTAGIDARREYLDTIVREMSEDG
jgi:hypothetical protein